MKDYLNNNKWEFGRIHKKLGRLIYLVKLDDERIWKRHVNQFRIIGVDTPLTNNIPSTISTYIPPTTPTSTNVKQTSQDYGYTNPKETSDYTHPSTSTETTTYTTLESTSEAHTDSTSGTPEASESTKTFTDSQD